MFRANNFDKLLDKATSNLRLDPDWPTILQICDLIRQNDCTPKYAMAAIKKKLYSQNPHQAMFALLTLESIVKNCGSGVHDEVASKAVCEMLRDLVKSTPHENLRNKILELIQAWAFAFRNTPKYRAVQDTVNILKAECFKFPPLKESDAMFSADTAPEWADGEVCHRCRVAFSLMVRRHHCRACGQVFCQQCSSKTSTLPKFGIEKEVRVCDACYDKVSRPPTSSAKLEIVDTASDYGPTAAAAPKRAAGGKSAEELQEEEELQLALALSQSEAEHKEKERARPRSHVAPSAASIQSTVSPTPSSVSVSPEHSAGNAELSRYLDRGYWEQRLARDPAAAAAPTAPVSSQASTLPHAEYMKPTKTKAQEDDEEDKEIDEFVGSLKSQVEIFVNRMKSNSSRGRSIANDTAVQSLFMNITAMHSRLLRYIQQQDDKRVYLESLQDKVTQIRDSRAALDTLRAEHAMRLAAAAEAADRQRQMQMAAKLQTMRKKKHEYLQYQRQLALQRVQEQEREMQMRQEQQKHQYLMSGGGNYYMGGGTAVHQFQPPYQSPNMYANPQYHGQMITQPSTDGNIQVPGQPLMSQANMQLGTIATSMPQMTQAYSITTPASLAMSQPNNMQGNIRQPLTQQMLANQMLMQQMHQLRLSSQPGAMQMMPQNGYSANIPQVNGQPAKQNIPGQPSQMIQAVGQPQINANNPMLGVQMSNMRMPMMQSTQPGQGYNVNQLANMQQPLHMQAQGQMSLPGQQMMQTTLPAQNMQNNPNVQGQVPQSQGQQLPQQQLSQGQPMSMPQMNMQMMQGQPLMSQAQSIPQQMMHNVPVQGQLPQTQQMPNQGQQFSHPQPGQLPNQAQIPQQIVNQGQPQMTHQPNPQQLANLAQASQGQHIPNQGQPGQMIQQMPNQAQPGQMTQPNQVQLQNAQQQMQNVPQQMQNVPQQMQNAPQQMQNVPQQISQGQQMPQVAPLKQNFGNNAPGPIQQQAPQQQHAPQQQQQAQTNAKPEHNNNTAELINFD